MHLCDVQIHLTLTSMDQSGFMHSSHGVAILNRFSKELLIIFLNSRYPFGLQEKHAIFNSMKSINRFLNCVSN